jgi:SAM-dependent methyltransferase
VLTEIPGLDPVFAEMHRVLRPGGRALFYLMLTTDLLEPEEAIRFHGGKLASMDAERVEAAITAAGLRIDERIEIGSEWGERAEEETGKPGRRLLWAARLMRQPHRYIERFGERNYETCCATAIGTCTRCSASSIAARTCCPTKAPALV